MDVQRVRLVLGNDKGPALVEKRKTLNDYSKFQLCRVHVVCMFNTFKIIESSLN